VTDIGAGALRPRSALGGVALMCGLALLALPAILAIADPGVLGSQHDPGWLGSPITRFATLQTVGMAVPLVLGALAVRRDRGRDLGAMAVLVALLGNYLLLRVLLGLVVRTVLV
jgi:hypothetical protein